MRLDDITPLILTFNEEPNLARTLAPLAWARRIVVVDSGSTDGTQEIARAHPNVELFVRPFTTHAEQWNFGLEQTGITTNWVLSLDADFLVDDAFANELAVMSPSAEVSGLEASFVYCVAGEPLRSGVYPPVVVLFRHAWGRYRQDGHTQRVQVTGRVLPLTTRIRHDDRKPLRHWIASQVRYMTLEADKLESADASRLGTADRMRRLIVVAPMAALVYCLLVRGGVLDGWRGVFYALQRAVAEAILSLTLLERRLTRR